MKETPIFEEVFTRTLALPGFWIKILIGGLLSFIPVVNFFAFGYLYRLSRDTRSNGSLALPDWTDWKALFMDGLRFAVVWLAYWLLPLLLALFIANVFKALNLSALAYLVMTLVFLLSPILFTSALYRYNMRSDFKDLLDIALIVRMTYMEFARLVIPALVFFGVFFLALPLYGFALFFGFVMLILHTSLSYRAIEQRRAVAF